MTRADFPYWPSNSPPPSQRLPVLQQRWWTAQTGPEVLIVDEHGSTVAADIEYEVARHIVQVHNEKIGVTK